MRERDDAGRFVSPLDIEKYEVEVWDIVDGDLIKMLWSATERELQGIQEQYRDEPGIEIKVKELP